VIGKPHNDGACLGAITAEVASMVERREPELVAIADEKGSVDALARWIRALPQRDDTGLPCDGPKVDACRPPQRLRVPADDPNCVERSALYVAVAELIDPTAVRRLATVDTPGGLHTFPTENGEPVILDPLQSRNCLRAGLFRARRRRNGSKVAALSPTEAVDWLAELAAEPAARFTGGPRRVRNGHRALRGVLVGRPLCLVEVQDVAFLLALADREARAYGAPGPRVVKTTASAVERLDQLAAERWLERAAPRNAGFKLGPLTIKPPTAVLGALARVGGRLGYQVGVEALRAKLSALGVGAPFIKSIERELNHEGLSLGALAVAAPMSGTLGAMVPQALAGRWIARKIWHV
jgi:hypothetical protein